MSDQQPDPWALVRREIELCRDAAATYDTTLDTIRVQQQKDAEITRLLHNIGVLTYERDLVQDNYDKCCVEQETLREKLREYELAVQYPGNDQRHQGTSTATQLVYTQHMREKAEVEVESLRAQLADIREACPSARVQYHAAKTTLELVQQEVSRGFNRDAELSQVRAQLAAVQEKGASLLARVRPNVEAAPWMISELQALLASCGKPLTLKEKT